MKAATFIGCLVAAMAVSSQANAGFKIEEQPVARPQPVAQQPVAQQSVWVVKHGQRISDSVRAWAKVAGWNGVQWDATELVLDSDQDLVFYGSFEDAIRQTMDAIPGMRATLFEGNKFIKIILEK